MLEKQRDAVRDAEFREEPDREAACEGDAADELVAVLAAGEMAGKGDEGGPFGYYGGERRKGEEGRDGQCAEIRGAGVAYLGHGAHGS